MTWAALLSREYIISTFKNLKAKEKARPLSAMNFKKYIYQRIMLIEYFLFDEIGFKSIRIIEKRRPAVRHTFEGSIIFV